MNVVFPAPFTPTTRMTVGGEGATINPGSLFPAANAAAISFAMAC